MTDTLRWHKTLVVDALEFCLHMRGETRLRGDSELSNDRLHLEIGVHSIQHEACVDNKLKTAFRFEPRVLISLIWSLQSAEGCVDGIIHTVA
jgi:hypothetical protein